MVCEPQVVVGTEGKKGLVVYRRACSGDSGNGRTEANAVLSFEGNEVRPQGGIKTREHGATIGMAWLRCQSSTAWFCGGNRKDGEVRRAGMFHVEQNAPIHRPRPLAVT